VHALVSDATCASPLWCYLEGVCDMWGVTAHTDAAAHGLWVCIHAQPLHCRGCKTPHDVTALHRHRIVARDKQSEHMHDFSCKATSCAKHCQDWLVTMQCCLHNANLIAVTYTTTMPAQREHAAMVDRLALLARRSAQSVYLSLIRHL
jgi:hypothetical protein